MKLNCSSGPQGPRSDFRSATFPTRTSACLASASLLLSLSSESQHAATAEQSAALADEPDFVAASALPETTRVLLALDVPTAALPTIEADWSLVRRTTETAPGFAAEVTAAALDRLFAYTVQVSGVAAMEPVENPLARWVRAAA